MRTSPYMLRLDCGYLRWTLSSTQKHSPFLILGAEIGSVLSTWRVAAKRPLMLLPASK